MPVTVAEPPKKRYLDEMDMTSSDAESLGSPVLSRVYHRTAPTACIFHECKSECKKDCSSYCRWDEPCGHQAWG